MDDGIFNHIALTVRQERPLLTHKTSRWKIPESLFANHDYILNYHHHHHALQCGACLENIR